MRGMNEGMSYAARPGAAAAVSCLLAATLLCAVSLGASAAEPRADYSEGFESGFLDFRNDWDAGAADRYAAFYRVDRLSPGFLVHGRTSYCASAPHDYFYEQVNQIVKPCWALGFWDDRLGCWAGTLLWSRVEGWDGLGGHDWRFSVELQEGALMASLIMETAAMDGPLKAEFEYMRRFISSDGAIDGLSIADYAHEYGLVLSALSLGVRYLAGRGDIEALTAVIADMDRVFHYIVDNYPSASAPGESMAIVLRGFANAYHAQTVIGDYFDRQRCRVLVAELSSRLIATQGRSGSFVIGDKYFHVQKQLKIDIALMLANGVLDDAETVESVKENLGWVVANRWDASPKRLGGIMWSADDLESYFECHQMWFLIVAAYLERCGEYGFRAYKEDAFAFLTDDNFAGVDMFVHNAERYGAFFAYRAISRDGDIQKNAFHQWKGAYEIGASLWALALNYDARTDGHSWLATQAPERASTGWDKAIYTTRDFGGGAWIFRWDAKFADARFAGAYTGLFNDQGADWRILLDTTTGLCYRDTGDSIRTLFDRSMLESNAVYTVTVAKEGKTAAAVRLDKDGTTLVDVAVADLKPLSRCYFGVLQYNPGPISARNIYVDNLACAYAVEAPLPPVSLRCFPNPFLERTCFEYNAVARGRVRLAIFDAAGRLVREISREDAESGTQQLFWDGTSAAGEPVASGVYFCAIEGPGLRGNMKVVRLR